MRAANWVLGLVFVLSATATVLAADSAPPDLAKAFGAQERLLSPELSPDGKHVSLVAAGPGTTNLLYVFDVASGSIKAIARAEGNPLRLRRCGWSALDRLICTQSGIVRSTDGETRFIPYSRLLAIDIDGKNMVNLGRKATGAQLYGQQFDGDIIDWLGGSEGKVLISRYYVPEQTTGRLTASSKEGYGVDLVDTRTAKSASIQSPKPHTEYWSDGRGEVRLMSEQEAESDGQLTSEITYRYRKPGEEKWRRLGTSDEHTEFAPLAVDSGANRAFVLKPLNGRQALYGISLDGSLATELVFAHPEVDVEGIVTIGRQGRVIGASYSTDKPHIEYFDPVYKGLAASFARALPRLPLISFASSDAEEKTLLILASSDDDPGHLYLYRKEAQRLTELLLVRPELRNIKLANVRHVQYTAADGVPVPAYLTLPPGMETAKGLPAIVMPHGGPAARDVWGFDWLAQYFAARGFAVLQPNFRGSAGYGSEWFVKNGFQSWRVAIDDVIDGGRWLVSQGIANPNKLAIAGWSYGGYAALQANVVDPSLFKAVVAIAPVTDLGLLKSEAHGFTSERLTRAFIGTGAHIEEGSPARHADRFTAPVLLFHGDLDANVDVAESRAMDRALKSAGKSSELIVYPALDHQLHDDAAREDMLKRSYEFLSRTLR